MDVRTRILEAAAGLLSRSADADVSTRAVCEAAGVGAPILYRHFGDKEGLLSAVVDFGFERYLAAKRVPRPSSDPVADLREGWDNHVRFAVENPNYYRLMYSPGLSVPPAAAAEAQRLLHEVIERIAAAGRLRVAPETATRMVMSANAGVALSLISRPALYPDPDFSPRVRDALVASITTPEATGTARPADATLPTAAATLAARLRTTPPTSLTPPETALLQQWLAILADTPAD
ncbi:transcriptional regulator, TetR family [Actinacidiphila alni]|uniref:Transcriptional regulator, TetR family n=1 Tax=Actinacidiphila alni TaxID=380248 RepID=A0A1I2IVX8_9ACTN|nr:TetR/AcrR family transcriptional regulator [Actinacidiphila alni]SFF44681.1 transcriptional regulator, TetR family [Actinacidiphila alni]